MKLVALLPLATLFIGSAASAQEPVQSETTPEKRPCGLLGHPCSYPHFALALEGGVVSTNESGPFSFDTGVGTVSHTGPSWGLRGGVELLSWFAIDAHYIGMNNHASGEAEPTGGVTLFTNAFNGELRFTVPLKYVQPYLFTGAGVYTTSITGATSAKNGSPLHGSTELGIPIGLGLGIPVTHAISVGGELTYHRLFGEEFSKNEEIGGGDFTTFNAVVRARL